MTSPRRQGRIYDGLRADGHTQMALDCHLLDTVRDGPAVRFYRWDGPWLSLGRHQRNIPQHWQALADAGELSMVRRPSGGDAVLHDGGLTYALVWPDAPRQRHQAYQQACQWLIDGFASLGYRLDFGRQPAVVGADNCFARSTAADLVDERGEKRIGSAQRWSQGRLLQHGEILLDPPAALWTAVFGSDAPAPADPRIPRDNLEDHLIAALQRQWDQTDWRHERLPTP